MLNSNSHTHYLPLITHKLYNHIVTCNHNTLSHPRFVGDLSKKVGQDLDGKGNCWNTLDVREE